VRQAATRRISRAALVAALVSGLTFAGEVFVYARGDLDGIGGAALLGVIAATAAGALYAARMDDGKSLCRAARSIPGDVPDSRRRGGPDGDDRRRRGLSGPRSGVRP
jgi:hypothetical protein